MRLPYSEGSVFLVPLRNKGYARGVVARASPRGKILMGYFFGPRLQDGNDITIDMEPSNSLLRCRFGDIGLINGEWKIVGIIPNWSRTDWPMPDFVRRDLLGRLKPILVRRADDDPSRIEVEYPIDNDVLLEDDSLAGYGAVELILTKLLESK